MYDEQVLSESGIATRWTRGDFVDGCRLRYTNSHTSSTDCCSDQAAGI